MKKKKRKSSRNIMVNSFSQVSWWSPNYAIRLLQSLPMKGIKIKFWFTFESILRKEKGMQLKVQKSSNCNNRNTHSKRSNFVRLNRESEEGRWQEHSFDFTLFRKPVSGTPHMTWADEAPCSDPPWENSTKC